MQPTVQEQDQGIMSYLKYPVHLPADLSTLREQYKNAKPFPHLVLDDFFDESTLKALCSEIPGASDETWVHHSDDRQEKFGLRSAISLGPEGYAFASFLHSASFLYLLSEITGIWGLLPDPYLQGGGFHMIPPGGYFDVHEDRKTDYTTSLQRRLVLITYLNENWAPNYGGELELWDKTGTRCESRLAPLFNRAVLFEVADNNYHGNPNPVACPVGRTRNSFATYFHTVPQEGDGKVDRFSSKFAPKMYRKEQAAWKKIARSFLPPIIWEVVNKARRSY
ncbi:hypothetical protein Terro_3865 [Terriglobus roseus DSM 18391]|uniref:Prolyl 4-hydroxylase alpha subunit Fe(2+) 2OG dioxygenase domain-containing protein n=1 Tax=Terriglobus roseus (strain DSM 18391 / NRRL B-41598 / KBS 63) TaxID=926566 RepID=I3ZLF6_TERRK|nr:2OG-Fe(II) oxygenase [Terriglobus roseus]AFL90074.1 hypothetical protein Terro_3865 [Terriglobus roseus DSM 18391]